jgi:hypothetical protein
MQVVKKNSNKFSTIITAIFYGVLTVVLVASTYFVLQGYVYAFRSLSHSGTIVSWEAAGAHSGRYDSFPIYNYVIHETTEQKTYTVSNTKLSYEEGQSITFYALQGSTEAHFNSGWTAFLSTDVQKTGRSYLVVALMFLLISLPLWVIVTTSIVMHMLGRPKAHLNDPIR